MRSRVNRPPSLSELPLFWIAVSILALLAGVVNASLAASDSGPPPARITAIISAQPYGSPVSNGFLGLSLEYTAIEPYAGQNPAALDPVFLQLVRNLTPGQNPVLRIGGDSADWTWWPVPGISRPPGVTYTLDGRWTQVTQALAAALHARLILGLNLTANSPMVAATEASALLGGISHNSVLAFQLGNEPELYATFPWYRTRSGRGITGRSAPYSFDAFLSDFSRVAAQLPAYPLAGPTTGGPGWLPELGRFLVGEPEVRLATVHRYPLQLCLTSPRSERYPTVGHLLSAAASVQFADGFAAPAAMAHAHHVPLRVDEVNSVSCGADAAVSQTFASALWALDTLFALKRVGVDGVHIHTFPGAGYELFRTRQRGGRWTASVAPEYYGLMMFAAAAPAGSRLLRLSAPAGSGLSLWATSAPDRRVRVVLINKSTTRAVTVSLHIAGLSGPAGLERLQAPGPAAGAGVTLGGQSFGSSTSTGRLSGRLETATIAPADGRYIVSVPPTSAALLAGQGG